MFIILEDADLELAAKNAIYGSFHHSGQICMSTNNVLGRLFFLNLLSDLFCARVLTVFVNESLSLSQRHLTVHESVADKFIDILKRQMKDIRAGPSTNPEENLLRGVFSDAHASHVNALVADAVGKGAKVVVGDPNTAGKHTAGNVVQPVVLDGLSPHMSE